MVSFRTISRVADGQRAWQRVFDRQLGATLRFQPFLPGTFTYGTESKETRLNYRAFIQNLSQTTVLFVCMSELEVHLRT